MNQPQFIDSIFKLIMGAQTIEDLRQGVQIKIQQIHYSSTTQDERGQKIIQQVIFPILQLFVQNRLASRKDDTFQLLAWLINVYQTDAIILDNIRIMFSKLIDYYQQNKQYEVFESFLAGIIEVQPNIHDIMHLILVLPDAEAIEQQLRQKHPTPGEQIALKIYQNAKIEKQPLRQPDNPFLQQLLKFGYNVTSQEFLLQALAEKHIRQVTAEFLARLLEFIIYTYKSGKIPQISCQAIAQSLQIQNKKLMEFNFENWNLKLLFKVVLAYAGEQQLKMQDILQQVNIDDYVPLIPINIFTVIMQLQFCLYTPKCYCQECSYKQNNFPLLEMLVDTTNRLQDKMRVALAAGIVITTTNINEMIAKQQLHLKTQMNYQANIDPSLVENYMLTQQYTFYINFKRLRSCTIGNASASPDVLQFYMDYLAQQWNRFNVVVNRECLVKQNGLQLRAQQSQPDQLAEQQLACSQYMWRSIDFVELLIKLRPGYSQIIDTLFINQKSLQNCQTNQQNNRYQAPVDKCFEQLALTVSAIYHTLQSKEPSEATVAMKNYIKCISSLCLYRFFNKQGRTKNNTPVIEQISRQTPDLIEFTLESIYQMQPQLCGKLLDTSQEQKCLQLCIKNPNNLLFGLDMATIAAGRQLINLSLYLNGQFLQIGLPFAEAVCVFVIKKLLKFNKAVKPDFENSDDYYKYTKLVGEEFGSCGQSHTSLYENQKLVKMRQGNIRFVEDFQLIKLSDAVISESLVGCYFRMMSYYQRYFIAISRLPVFKNQQKLFDRIDELFNHATELCLFTFPRIPMNLAAELSYTTDEIKQSCREKIRDHFFGGKTSSFDFLQDIDQLFKGQDIDNRFLYICIVNKLVECAMDTQYFVKYASIPGNRVDHAKEELFEILGDLLGQGLVQDIFQPKIINYILQCFQQNTNKALAKKLLDHFCDSSRNLNQKEEFKGLNFSQDWYSFYDVLQLFTAKELSPSSQKYIKEQAANVVNTVASSVMTIESVDQSQRSQDLINLLNQPLKLIQSICLDREIIELIQKHSQMLYKPVPVSSCQQLYMEQIRERFNILITQQDIQPYMQPLNDLRQIKDQNLVAEHLVFNVLPQLMKQEKLLGQLLIHLPELVQNSVKYCISAILRLVYVPQCAQSQLQQDHIEQRRQIIKQYGRFLGVYSCQQQQINIISRRTLDFEFLLELGRRCNTIEVVSQFIQAFLIGQSGKHSMFPASNGFALVIIRKLQQVAENHFKDDIDTQPRQKLVDDDINQLKATLYTNNKNDKDILSGNLLISSDWSGVDGVSSEVVKTSLTVPAAISSKKSIEILQACDHITKVPLHLTMNFVFANPELLNQLRIAQLQQKYRDELSDAKDRISDTIQTTINLMLVRMIPGFNMGNLQHKEIFQMCTSKVGYRLLRAHMLKPVADQIYEIINKKFTLQSSNEELVDLIQEKIILQLAYMASESIIHVFQNQIKQQFYMKGQKNQQIKYELQDDVDQTPLNQEPTNSDEVEKIQVSKQTQEALDKVMRMYQQTDENVALQFQQLDFDQILNQIYLDNACGAATVQINYQNSPGMYDVKVLTEQQLCQSHAHNIIAFKQNQINHSQSIQNNFYKLFKSIIVNQQKYAGTCKSVHFLPISNQLKGQIGIILQQNMMSLHKNDKNTAATMMKYLAMYVLQSISINVNTQIFDNTDLIQNECFSDDVLGGPKQLNSLMRLSPGSAHGVSVQYKQAPAQIVENLFEQNQSGVQLAIQNIFKQRFLKSSFDQFGKMAQLLSSDSQIQIVPHILNSGNQELTFSVVFDILFCILTALCQLQTNHQNQQISQLIQLIRQQLITQNNNLLLSCLICDLCESSRQKMNAHIENQSVYRIYRLFLQNIYQLDQRLQLARDRLDNYSQLIVGQLQLSELLDVSKCISSVFCNLMNHLASSKGTNQGLFGKTCHKFSNTFGAIAEALNNAIYKKQYCVNQPINLDFLTVIESISGESTIDFSKTYHVGQYDTYLEGTTTLLAEYYTQSYEQLQPSIPDSVIFYLNVRQQVNWIMQNRQDNISSHFNMFCQIDQHLSEAGMSKVYNNVILSFLFQGQLYLNVQNTENIKQLLKNADSLLFGITKQQVDYYVENEMGKCQPQTEHLVNYLYICILVQQEQVFNCFDPKLNKTSLKVLLLKIIFQRLAQLASVFTSYSVSIQQKIALLDEQMNYDLSDSQLDVQAVVGGSQKPETHEKFVNPTSCLIHQVFSGLLQRLLPLRAEFEVQGYSFQSTMIRDLEEEQFKFHYFDVLVAALLQCLQQFKPQIMPQFAYQYLQILSEPQLLWCLQPLFTVQSINYRKFINLLQTKNPLYGYESEMQVQYSKCLKHLLQYSVGQYLANNKIIEVKRIYSYSLKLLLLIRQNKQYINQFRLFLSQGLSPQAIDTRNLIMNGYSDNQYQISKTDDVNGLLSIPETDQLEYYYFDDSEFTIPLTTASQDVCLQLKAFLLQANNQLENMNIFLVRLLTQLHKQLKKTTLEQTACYQLLLNYNLFQMIGTDAAFNLLNCLSGFLGQPSQQTYLAAVLLKGIYEKVGMVNISIKENIKRVVYERNIREPGYGAQVLFKWFQRIGAISSTAFRKLGTKE